MEFNRDEESIISKETLLEWIPGNNENLVEGETAITWVENGDGTITANGGYYTDQTFADWFSFGSAVFEDYDGRGDPDGYWQINDGVWKWVMPSEMTEDNVIDQLENVDDLETMPEAVGNAVRAAIEWIKNHPTN